MLLSAVADVVADTTPPADKVSPGIAGFLVVFALALATVVLIRSMVGHLRKVRYSPEPDGTSGDEPAQTPTAPADRADPIRPAPDGRPPSA